MIALYTSLRIRLAGCVQHGCAVFGGKSKMCKTKPIAKNRRYIWFIWLYLHGLVEVSVLIWNWVRFVKSAAVWAAGIASGCG
jgi:hypothetical protein